MKKILKDALKSRYSKVSDMLGSGKYYRLVTIDAISNPSSEDAIIYHGTNIKLKQNRRNILRCVSVHDSGIIFSPYIPTFVTGTQNVARGNHSFAFGRHNVIRNITIKTKEQHNDILHRS